MGIKSGIITSVLVVCMAIVLYFVVAFMSWDITFLCPNLSGECKIWNMIRAVVIISVVGGIWLGTTCDTHWIEMIKKDMNKK